eukprot:jgi/Bigna1/76168/fgenesh1_pg.39_\
MKSNLSIKAQIKKHKQQLEELIHRFQSNDLKYRKLLPPAPKTATIHMTFFTEKNEEPRSQPPSRHIDDRKFDIPEEEKNCKNEDLNDTVAPKERDRRNHAPPSSDEHSDCHPGSNAAADTPRGEDTTEEEHHNIEENGEASNAAEGEIPSPVSHENATSDIESPLLSSCQFHTQEEWLRHEWSSLNDRYIRLKSPQEAVEHALSSESFPRHCWSAQAREIRTEQRTKQKLESIKRMNKRRGATMKKSSAGGGRRQQHRKPPVLYASVSSSSSSSPLPASASHHVSHQYPTLGLLEGVPIWMEVFYNPSIDGQMEADEEKKEKAEAHSHDKEVRGRRGKEEKTAFVDAGISHRKGQKEHHVSIQSDRHDDHSCLSNSLHRDGETQRQQSNEAVLPLDGETTGESAVKSGQTSDHSERDCPRTEHATSRDRLDKMGTAQLDDENDDDLAHLLGSLTSHHHRAECRLCALRRESERKRRYDVQRSKLSLPLLASSLKQAEPRLNGRDSIALLKRTTLGSRGRFPLAEPRHEEDCNFDFRERRERKQAFDQRGDRTALSGWASFNPMDLHVVPPSLNDDAGETRSEPRMTNDDKRGVASERTGTYSLKTKTRGAVKRGSSYASNKGGHGRPRTSRASTQDIIQALRASEKKLASLQKRTRKHRRNLRTMTNAQ